jgi:hypothetical protein
MDEFRREKGMNLRARVFIENQKKDGEARFVTRLALLQGKGMSPEGIKRDATIRRIKAIIRKAETRLAAVHAQERLTQERAQAKLDKLAAKAAARDAASAEPAEEGPAKKPKKSKKQPSGKEVKPEKKKEKKEKRVEPEEKK